jgi:hypothetical protein
MLIAGQFEHHAIFEKADKRFAFLCFKTGFSKHLALLRSFYFGADLLV